MPVVCPRGLPFHSESPDPFRQMSVSPLSQFMPLQMGNGTPKSFLHAAAVLSTSINVSPLCPLVLRVPDTHLTLTPNNLSVLYPQSLALWKMCSVNPRPPTWL